MVSSKLFYIKECWFNLPDDFNGTCGEALMLLAKYRLGQENKNKIGAENELLKKDDGSEDLYATLVSKNDRKATLAHAFLKLNEETNTYINV